MERKMSWRTIAAGVYHVLVVIGLLAGVIAGDLSIGRAVECLGVVPAQAASSFRLSVPPGQACLFPQ